MILRSLRLQGGRIALPRRSAPLGRWRRTLTSDAQHTSISSGAAEHPEAEIVEIGGRRYEVRDPTHPVVHNLLRFQHQKAVTGHIGGDVEPHYEPYKLLSDPPAPKDVTLELLMASQAHLGHATSLWHPGNAKYIFGIRGPENPIHIIALDVTAAHLRRAATIVRGVTERGGLVLFVGTRNGQARAVVKAAEMAKGCHLFTRWIPGSLTNGQQILGKCRKMVVNEHDQEVPGFDEQLIQGAAIKPDLVVCLNPLENYILLHECGMHNIPTIGIVDTNCNPTWVTYPIPANDDSSRSVQLIAGVLGRAGQDGQQSRLQQATEGHVTYHFEHGLKMPERASRGLQGIQTQQDEQLMEQELRATIAANAQTNGSAEEGGASPQASIEDMESSEIDEVDPSLLGDQAVEAREDVLKQEASQGKTTIRAKKAGAQDKST